MDKLALKRAVDGTIEKFTKVLKMVEDNIILKEIVSYMFSCCAFCNEIARGADIYFEEKDDIYFCVFISKVSGDPCGSCPVSKLCKVVIETGQLSWTYKSIADFSCEVLERMAWLINRFDLGYNGDKRISLLCQMGYCEGIGTVVCGGWASQYGQDIKCECKCHTKKNKGEFS